MTRDNAQALMDRAADRYYAWVRQMLTLTAGALTLLVSFQRSLVPADAKAVWAIQACWMSLALAVAMAATILHSEYRSLKLLGMARTQKDHKISPRGVDLDQRVRSVEGHLILKQLWIDKWTVRLFPWLLTFALSLLTLYAVLNTRSTNSLTSTGLSEHLNNSSLPTCFPLRLAMKPNEINCGHVAPRIL
jgi:hypothetical protein